MPAAVLSAATEPLAAQVQPLEAAAAAQALPTGPVALLRTANGTGPYAERITSLAALLDGAPLAALAAALGLSTMACAWRRSTLPGCRGAVTCSAPPALEHANILAACFPRTSAVRLAALGDAPWCGHAGLGAEVQAVKAGQRELQQGVQQALALGGVSLPAAQAQPAAAQQPLPAEPAPGAAGAAAAEPASGAVAAPGAETALTELQALRSALGVVVAATHAMAMRSCPPLASAPRRARASMHVSRGSLARRSIDVTGLSQLSATVPAATQAAPADSITDATCGLDVLCGHAASALQELTAALAAGSIGHKLDSGSVSQVCCSRCLAVNATIKRAGCNAALHHLTA